MRKVTFGGASSLDGYFARPDHSVDWLMWSGEAAEVANAYWHKVDTIVMGRKTWEIAVQRGPSPLGDDSGIKTYVFSRTLPAGDNQGASIVNDDPGEFVRELRSQQGKDICIMGGGNLAKSLLEAGVIDELGLNIHPVLLGAGIPVFFEMKSQIDLELLECRPFKNGCVYVLYKVKN
jgi:dihydrofolate reductase